MDNCVSQRDVLFQQVYEHVQKKGIPVKFPPSLLCFTTISDVQQEFWVGVSKRLLKVKKFEPGTGTSPEIGYVIDGGVKAVQDYVRKVCNRNLLPHCSCKIWAIKKYDTCPKCGGEISYSSIFGEDIISESSTNIDPDKLIDSKLEVQKFSVYLEKRKAKKAVELFNILCGHDLGPCNICPNTCKGSISDFEYRRDKWRSGCVNMPDRVAKYWGIGAIRVGVIFKQLTTLANKFIRGE